MLQDIKTIRRSKYDQVIVTSGINPVKAGLYLFLTGIRIRCGDYRSQTLSFYTLKCRFDPAISRTLGNYHLFALLFRFPPLDRISTDIRFRDLFRTRYYFSKDSADAATGFLNSALSPHSFIVAIHPGCNAQNRYRRWNPEYFITLITLLRTRFPDWGFYIIAGPDEKEEGNMISRSTGSPLLTDVSLDIVAATLQQSHLLINTDSGIGHIASCFHLRTYTIFGPGDERQTAPQNPRAKVIRSSLPCAPCNQRKITRCQAECLSSLTPELVAEGIVKDYDERQ
ncbi:MAG: glycosyltransferase family 9 protein [Candidatus Cloacimonetes bacterium]|nr:glycosyltransferase family 9 protein [Candidatus Cloacimonadota bacterium]